VELDHLDGLMSSLKRREFSPAPLKRGHRSSEHQPAWMV